MGRGSVLKNLKTDLEKNGLLRHQKRKKGDAEHAREQRQRDNRALETIRTAFNPFDVKFNRTKSELRKNDSSNQAGRPAASRSLAEKQRRQTWEAQKRLKNKVGGLVDRRFGEQDRTMSEEDKMVERYARERLNRMRKSFNIEDNDEESAEDMVLTHGGSALSFQDDFAEDDLGVDDQYSDSAPPQKRVRRMGDADGSGSVVEGEEEPIAPVRQKTKAEVMQEVIAKSKMYKLQRQQERAHDDEIVDDLNANFDELMSDLNELEARKKAAKRQVDSYDSNLQEFAYDKRADPKDRTKTDEEIANEEEKRRKAAEKAIMARMEGDELDIGPEDIGNDAEMFGLQTFSDEEQGSQSDDDAGLNENDAENMESVNVPESLADLRRAINGSEEPPVQRIKHYVKVAMPGRGRGNQEKLQKLSVAILEYAVTTQSEFRSLVEILHDTAPKHDVGLVLANASRDLVNSAKRRKLWGKRELLLLSLVGSLFSTSDQWHVVATSSMLVMTQRLSQSVDGDLSVITTNLFLCDLLLTYQRLSKRYVPEISAYILRLLTMFKPEIASSTEHLVRLSDAHVPIRKLKPEEDGAVKLGESLSAGQAAVVASKIVGKAASLWRSTDAFPEIFQPLVDALSSLSSLKNKVISGTIEKVTKLITFARNERKFLELQNFRPIGIATHMPLFDENYNPEVKGANMDPQRRELAKLKALHKKERKSTLREIRRDAEFEAREKLADKRSEMSTYHDKLRRLEGQINGEEGAEKNAYEREKSKRKR